MAKGQFCHKLYAKAVSAFLLCSLTGTRTVYPVQKSLTLNKGGALIKGDTVTISGGSLETNGTIEARGNGEFIMSFFSEDFFEGGLKCELSQPVLRYL